MKKALRVIALAVAGALVGAAAGFALGGVLGLALTAVNNHLLTGTAQGSYVFWALFLGELIALFAWIPGAAVAVAVGFRRGWVGR